MALVTCPKCGKNGFTWSDYSDEEPSPWTTHWNCHECKYFCKEDESQAKICPNCDNKTYLLLKDTLKEYRFCIRCATYTSIL